MKHSVFFIVFICLFSISFSSYGQSRRQLETKRKNLNKKIALINSLLIKTEKKKSSALDDLKDLNQKISVRERLIETIELESEELQKEIKTNEKQLKKYNRQLKDLKKEYADMVVKTHKSKSQQSKTMFLLSSKNFYQAYKRIKYMQQYADFRKKQGEEIIIKTEEIKQLNDSLVQKKKTKELLISDEKSQKEEIESDKKNHEKLVSKIKKEEKRYKSELQKRIREEKRLTSKIDKLIRDAIRRANKARNKKNKKATSSTKKTKSTGLVLNEAEKKLLAKFEQNKGILPWPVNGVITRKFGIQPHPTFPGINVNSPGLTIVTKSATDAQSIFNGKVLVLQSHSGGKKSVLVQHGNYISAYNNLESVYVKRGDVVKTGDKLGKVFTDKVSGKTKLGFMLYKNSSRLNPSSWIRKR